MYCKNGGQQLACEPYHYCDGNTTYPYGKLCENGFYGTATGTGWSDAANCTACINAKFCTGGHIVGDCAPGYICVTEADSHTPNATNLTDKAYPCPLGYYCSEGAQAPTKCPPATFTFELAAKQETECTICQMGYYCPFDESIPYACPAGSYCGFGVFAPTTCPVGTY